MFFTAFLLDMSGSDFSIPARRMRPEDVSESQREFIDLSFRMALMAVASDNGSSLVIDTPEASLDAVFARHAAETLLSFAAERDNTLMIASNYVDGELLPSLIKGIGSMDRSDARIIDLLRIAKPTAAVRRDLEAYEGIRDRLMEGIA